MTDFDLNDAESPEERDAAERVLREEDEYSIPADLLLDQDVEEEEARLSLSEEIKRLNVGQKLKLALKGGREARAILFRGNNRMIKRFVLRNPRISDDELIQIARNRSEEREFIEFIAKQKEWMKNYSVMLAVVTNPKTPPPLAMRFVPSLRDRDLRQLAKSKNVPTPVNSMAKRLVIQRSQ